jgi:2Fe-2S ferredoxin
MATTKPDIRFTLLEEDDEYVINTYNSEYRNLMVLINEKIYLEDFGECRGMGRCGTCIVEVVKKDNELFSFDRNEEATIKKTGITNPNYRLACQILVDEKLANATFRILNNI